MRSGMTFWLAAALLGTPLAVQAQNSCAVTAPTNGYAGNCPSTLASGSSCQLECASSYFLNGSATSCSNGVLTEQTCEPASSSGSCAVTPPVNGLIGSCPSTLASGNSCSFVCNANDYIVGNATSCSSGVLTAQTCSTTPPVCAVTPPPNGNYGTCSSYIASGTSCNITCDTGYAVSGNDTACSYGTLVATQSCTPLSCAVTAPANGTLGTCSSPLASGSACQFTCNSGYTLTGAATVCSFGALSAQTCTMSAGGSTNVPLPLWALGTLGAGLMGFASWRLRKRGR
jgi:hypothetical protein